MQREIVERVGEDAQATEQAWTGLFKNMHDLALRQRLCACAVWSCDSVKATGERKGPPQTRWRSRERASDRGSWGARSSMIMMPGGLSGAPHAHDES